MQRKREIDMFNNVREFDFFEFKLEILEMADNYWIYWNSKTVYETWNDIDYIYKDSISYTSVATNENNKQYENLIDKTYHKKKDLF